MVKRERKNGRPMRTWTKQVKEEIIKVGFKMVETL